jgi:uncharacterized protein YndB with AHSA1/START domain
MNDTLRTVDGRSVLRIERRLAHPPETVWRAITEPAHLAAWFPSNVEMDLRPGGRVRFVFPDGAGPETEGAVMEVDPPHVLAYTWDDNLLRYELFREGDGCRLVFSHTFDDREGAASFASGWTVCLSALGMVLDGRPVQVDHPPSMHEDYVHRFGLDEGTWEDTQDGWRVRFERQLTRRAEHVWARLGAERVQRPVIGGSVPHGFVTVAVPAGTITAVDAPRLLEYESGTGRVRWELGEGTGHGARLILTHTATGTDADARATALRVWRDHIEALAHRLLSEPAPPPSWLRATTHITDDGRTALRFQRAVAHPPEKVWRALTEREHLAAWFPAAVDLDVPAGTAIEFAPGSTGTVLRCDPPKLLEYTWDAELLRWELTPDGDGGCRLVMTHVLDDPTAVASLAGGWHAGLEVLVATLDGRLVDWSVWDRDRELKDQYAGIPEIPFVQDERRPTGDGAGTPTRNR